MTHSILSLRVRRAVLVMKLKRATAHKRELSRALKKANHKLMAAELKAARSDPKT